MQAPLPDDPVTTSGEPAPQRRRTLAALRRPLVFTFFVALVVHTPFTPLFPLLRVLQRAALLREDKRDWDYKDESKPDLSVPIELVQLPPKPDAPGGDAVALPADKPAPKAPQQPDSPPQKSEVKLGAGKTAESPPKDGDDKAVGPGEKEKKAKLDDKKRKDGDDRKDEVGLKGTTAKLAGKPNVSLALWFEPIRTHELAKVADKLFACAPEWRPFIAEGISPLSDLEGVLVVGPKLSDASKMTAAVQHRLEPERMKGVADAIVQRTGGGWYEPEVARVRLMKHDRAMFTHPTSMIFLTPKDSYKAIHASRDPMSLPPSGGRALAVSLQKPARPLKKLGLRLPDRLTELRLDVFANPDGSADMQLDFEDVGEAEARADAKLVTATVQSLFADLSSVTRTVDALVDDGGNDATLRLPEVSFDAVEKRLTATAHFDTRQTSKMLSLLGRVVCAKPKAKATKE